MDKKIIDSHRYKKVPRNKIKKNNKKLKTKKVTKPKKNISKKNANIFANSVSNTRSNYGKLIDNTLKEEKKEKVKEKIKSGVQYSKFIKIAICILAIVSILVISKLVFSKNGENILSVFSNDNNNNEELEDNYNFKIYPIIQTVCSTLAGLDGVKSLGVIATPATINSHAYSKGIAKYNKDMKVYELAAPNWVRIVEEHRIHQPQSIEQIKEILEVMKENNPDKIVLACTHYPYLLDVLKKFLPEDKYIDPAIFFAQSIKNDLEKNNLLGQEPTYERFYVSSDPENFKIASELFYKLDILPELV